MTDHKLIYMKGSLMQFVISFGLRGFQAIFHHI